MRGGEQKKVTSLRLLVPSLKLETLEKEIGGRKINKGHVVFWWSMNHQQYRPCSTFCTSTQQTAEGGMNEYLCNVKSFMCRFP